MSLAHSAQQIVNALLAKSAYTGDPSVGWLTIESEVVERNRSALGGHLALRPEIQVNWLLQQREDAIRDAEAGNLGPAALLWKSICTDGTFAGVLAVRSAGTVSLPRRWRGDPNLIAQLELGHKSVRSIYDEMVPPDQAELMIQDGIGMGVAVGELLPVPGRNYPVLRRLPPEGLRYRWASTQGNWFYNTSVGGQIPITKGDGRWVLWEPGGTDAAPWERGAWIYASRAYINKEHAILEAANFCRTLANPAIVTTVPQGASDGDRTSWFEAFAAWGLNMVCQAPPGYDAKVLEVNGQGFRAFRDMIDACNIELIVSVAGQEVSTTGGSGFVSTPLFQTVREDLVRRTANSWAHLNNTQIIPPWTVRQAGIEALEGSPCLELDSKAPKDLTQVANSWASGAAAILKLEDALRKVGRTLDVQEAIAQLSLPAEATEGLNEEIQRQRAEPRLDVLLEQATVLKAIGDGLSSVRNAADQFGVEVSAIEVFEKFGLKAKLKPRSSAPVTRLQLAPTDVARVVKVDEARESQGLGPTGDERGEKFVTEDTIETPPTGGKEVAA